MIMKLKNILIALILIASLLPLVLNGIDSPPLHLAVRNGQIDSAAELINSGAEIEAKDDQGNTALHNAVRRRNASLVTLLLKSGANASAINELGETPLHVAYGKEIITLLLEHGANLNAQDNHGKTPLYNAAYQGIGDLVSHLLTHNAKPDIADHSGRNALHAAVLHGNIALVTFVLINSEELLGATDSEGNTPLMLAIQLDRQLLINALRKAEAKSETKVKSIVNIAKTAFHGIKDAYGITFFNAGKLLILLYAVRLINKSRPLLFFCGFVIIAKNLHREFLYYTSDYSIAYFDALSTPRAITSMVANSIINGRCVWEAIVNPMPLWRKMYYLTACTTGIVPIMPIIQVIMQRHTPYVYASFKRFLNLE